MKTIKTVLWKVAELPMLALVVLSLLPVFPRRWRMVVSWGYWAQIAYDWIEPGGRFDGTWRYDLGVAIMQVLDVLSGYPRCQFCRMAKYPGLVHRLCDWRLGAFEVSIHQEYVVCEKCTAVVKLGEKCSDCGAELPLAFLISQGLEYGLIVRKDGLDDDGNPSKWEICQGCGFGREKGQPCDICVYYETQEKERTVANEAEMRAYFDEQHRLAQEELDAMVTSREEAIARQEEERQAEDLYYEGRATEALEAKDHEIPWGMR